jgi:subtilisin family serine protease
MQQNESPFWRLAGNKGEGVRVAMLDTGIDSGHPAFSDAHVIAQDFCGGNAGIDVDGHGTQCCGIILQTAPACTLLAGRILVNSGTFSSDALFAGLMWARRNDADVICVCTGERIKDVDVEDLVTQLFREGRIVAAAVGNQARNGAGAGLFPARCLDALAIGSAEEDGSLCSFTELPLDKEVMCLSGTHFIAPVPGTAYADVTGTSMSAALAAGLIALKRKQKVEDLSIAGLFRDCCDHQESARGPYRVLDPAKFLSRVS